MSIKRIAATGDLLAVWNDHSKRWKLATRGGDKARRRTPLALATSADEGSTWRNAKLIKTARNRGFYYTAFHGVDDSVLLAYSCGNGSNWGLPDSCIRRVTLDMDLWVTDSPPKPRSRPAISKHEQTARRESLVLSS